MMAEKENRLTELKVTQKSSMCIEGGWETES